MITVKIRAIRQQLIIGAILYRLHGGLKSKPLSNYQKIVLYRIKVCK